MKKAIIFILCLSTLFIFSGCGSNSVKSNIVGTWVVENTEANGGFMTQMGASVYEAGSEIEITKDGKYIILGQVATYELLEDQYIEIIDNMGATSKNKYELSENSLKIHFIDGKLIVSFKRK